MSKIAYIIPGYDEDKNFRKAYGIVAGYFKAAGIKPVYIKINWKAKGEKHIDFASYCKQFLKQYKKTKNDQTYVFGFSFGAVIAFLTAAQTKPDALLLCSLSPYFTEDYTNLKPAWLKWWKKHSAGEMRFADFSPRVSTTTFLMVGGKEYASVLARARSARRKITSSSLKIAADAKHNIGQRSYLAVIKETIDSL